MFRDGIFSKTQSGIPWGLGFREVCLLLVDLVLAKTKTNSLNWNKGFFQIKNKVGTNVG
jgi:hypothetical protein